MLTAEHLSRNDIFVVLFNGIYFMLFIKKTKNKKDMITFKESGITLQCS
jgi:hypothetical protein